MMERRAGVPLAAAIAESFTQELGELLRAGIDIHQACGALAQQSAYRKPATEIAAALAEGGTLSGALERLQVPREVYVFVQFGELTGDLARALTLSCEYLAGKRRMRERLFRLLAYPSLLFVLNVAVVYLLSSVVLPSFARMYQSLEVEEGAEVHVLFIAAALFRDVAPVLAGMLALLLLVSLSRKKEATRMLTQLSGKVGPLRRWLQFSRGYRSMYLLSFLLSGGIDVLAGLEHLRSLDAAGMGPCFAEIRDRLLSGATLSDSLAGRDEFPVIVSQVFALAERTGDLAEGARRLTDHLERALTRRQEGLVRWAEPVLTVMLGLTVGSATLVLMIPMMDMVGRLH
ncbi:MAG: type II secretion system F family protein [Firmicutes bacterium]|nr:type II secretion system F family protein [Bacillota bacterium]